MSDRPYPSADAVIESSINLLEMVIRTVEEEYKVKINTLSYKDGRVTIDISREFSGEKDIPTNSKQEKSFAEKEAPAAKGTPNKKSRTKVVPVDELINKWLRESGLAHYIEF